MPLEVSLSKHFTINDENVGRLLLLIEARQMPEMIKQEALQLEPLLESYEACKFPIHFL